MAVFERIDPALVARILGSCAGDASLELVSFLNQPGRDGHGVPDASISASVRYLFEVKTARGAVAVDQLQRHLIRLDGTRESERLFVLTPDGAKPPAIATMQDPKIVWFNFSRLTEAIDDVLQDTTHYLSEQSQFLLREFQALLKQDGLLADIDVMIVAAGKAYDEYIQHSAYICQPQYALPPGVKRIGFYNDKRVHKEFPLIKAHADAVEFTPEGVLELRASGVGEDATVADLVDRLLNSGARTAGGQHQVFVLSPADDPDTERLTEDVRHHGKGAWMQWRRYISSASLAKSPRTTAELI
jgi:hypothetical protein